MESETLLFVRQCVPQVFDTSQLGWWNRSLELDLHLEAMVLLAFLTARRLRTLTLAVSWVCTSWVCAPQDDFLWNWTCSVNFAATGFSGHLWDTLEQNFWGKKGSKLSCAFSGFSSHIFLDVAFDFGFKLTTARGKIPIVTDMFQLYGWADSWTDTSRVFMEKAMSHLSKQIYRGKCRNGRTRRRNWRASLLRSTTDDWQCLPSLVPCLAKGHDWLRIDWGLISQKRWWLKARELWDDQLGWQSF